MNHCWHTTTFQHAMMNHADVACCWCDYVICTNYELVPRADHGPYSPPDLRRIPDERYDSPCPARRT